MARLPSGGGPIDPNMDNTNTDVGIGIDRCLCHEIHTSYMSLEIAFVCADDYVYEVGDIFVSFRRQL